MGKRIRNIGIIFLLMMIVYKYAETTVIYQVEIIADQEDIGQNVIEMEQMNQQMMQMAIEGVYIMQTVINKPYKMVYLKEIPECGDHGLKWAKDYIAYKDLLVLGATVYKRQDGTYQPTDQTLSDLTKIEEPYSWRAYSQCENMIVALDKEETSFLVYDMDTAETCSYPCTEGRIVDGTNWCVYGGEIYYVEREEDSDGSWIRDTTIRKMDPHSGESVEFYRSEKPGLDSFWFFIREDGTIFFEWVEWGERFARRREYWKIQPNADGTWAETKLCEIDRWKFREFGECNEYGFFILGQYFEPTNGSLFEEIVIRDNGETETPVLVGEGWRLYCGNGYLVANKPQQEKGSVTFYDYHGNVVNTWQLIDGDYIEKGYELVNLLYYDGTITGFYQQESTKKLYIAQVDAELELYDNELKKCEWVWENREKVNDIKKNYPYFDPTYDELCLYGGDDLLMYCIQDLNGDDTPELIVGVHTVETILTEENGMDHWTESPTTRILIIYRYEEGKLRAEFVERDSLEIYKNGIIEYTRRMYGKYPGLEHHYYCYTPNSGKVKELEVLGESDEELEGKEPIKFFRVIDDEQQVEIAEEEYARQREFYIGEGKGELQWKELTGFLEGGETFEILAY